MRRGFLAWWSDTFTVHRWGLNPFQMYDLSFLFAVAIAQVVLGATPTSAQADLDRKTLLALAMANIAGCTIAALGLHMKDLETALWVEFYGYICLIFVLGTFVTLVANNTVNPNASYGFALGEAFVAASLHRVIQILLYKRARGKRNKLEERAELLSMVFPTESVEGEDDPPRGQR